MNTGFDPFFLSASLDSSHPIIIPKRGTQSGNTFLSYRLGQTFFLKKNAVGGLKIHKSGLQELSQFHYSTKVQVSVLCLHLVLS